MTSTRRVKPSAAVSSSSTARSLELRKSPSCRANRWSLHPPYVTGCFTCALGASVGRPAFSACESYVIQTQPDANAFSKIDDLPNATARVASFHRIEQNDVRTQLAKKMNGDIPTVRQLDQSIDRCEILHALLKCVHVDR